MTLQDRTKILNIARPALDLMTRKQLNLGGLLGEIAVNILA
jgi:hypothetical protein